MALTVDLATVKAYLGIAGSPDDPSMDPILSLWIDSAVELIKDMTGRHLEKATYRDTFQQRRTESNHVYVQETPVTGLNLISVGGVVVPETEYKWFGSGRIEFLNWHRHISTWWVHHNQHLVVEYVGGIDVLPATMQAAVYAAIQAAWQAHKQMLTFGGQIKQVSVIDVGQTQFATRTDFSAAAMKNTLDDYLEDYIADNPIFGGHFLQECERIGDAPGSPG